MDFGETGLELLIKKLKDNIDAKLSSLSASDISLIPDNFPEFKTNQELRDIRESILSKFNNPEPMQQSSIFSETLLSEPFKKIDETDHEMRKSMIKFFEKQMEDVSHKRSSIISRTKHNADGFINIKDLTDYMDSLSRYSYSCEEALKRLKSEIENPFVAKDILLELTTRFAKRHQNIFLKSILMSVSYFPITNRKGILENMFRIIEEIDTKDYENSSIPVYPITEKDMDESLVFYANVFKLNPDLSLSDGREFLYRSEKIFVEMFPMLHISNYTKSTRSSSSQHSTENLQVHAHKIFIKNEDTDLNFAPLIDQYVFKSFEEVSRLLNKFVTQFNETVGNEIRGKFNRSLIPLYKIKCLAKLRFIRSKYLATSLLSLCNYFEYVQIKLTDFDTKLQQGVNKFFPDIIEIYDNNEKVLFPKALEVFKGIKGRIVMCCSKYSIKYEQQHISNVPDVMRILDRELLIERLFELELKFLNAKRVIVNVLMEISFNTSISSVKEYIDQLIDEEPRIDLSIFNAPETSYEVSIKLLEVKARVLRFLLNSQILHERHLGVRLGDYVPLFYRPSVIKTACIRKFVESVATSPFEIYPSVGKILKLLSIVPSVSREFSESIFLIHSKYSTLAELSVWNELEMLFHSLVQTGVFPFDRGLHEFSAPLADSVKTLFDSPYINELEMITSILTDVNESKKLRFVTSMKRFFNYAWKLQKAIIITDILQRVYFIQSEQLQLENTSVLMNHFVKRIFDKDDRDSNLNETSNRINFAYTEFENVEVDFGSESYIKDVIFASDFTILQKLLTFQRMQCMILTIACRYNAFFLDSSLIVNHFGLNSGSDTFVTGTDAAEDDDKRLKRQAIAAKIFWASTTKYRDYSMALAKKSLFSVDIFTVKSKCRTIINAHSKHTEMSNDELFDIYLNEMCDSFAPYIYKVEIARICGIERITLLSNCFTDVYVLGPETSYELLNDSGNFSKFYYVPTWVEILTMLHDAPYSRQKMILSSLLRYVISRLRIFYIVRMERSLPQRFEQVVQSLYEKNFKLETPIFQNILKYLESGQDAKEVEISAKYMTSFEYMLFIRFEFALLNSFHSFYVSNITNVKGDKVPDKDFDNKIKKLWEIMHEKVNVQDLILHSKRYIPQWTLEFARNCHDSDRYDIYTQLSTNDKYICGSLNVESMFNNISDTIDFLMLVISQMYIKFAFFLVLAGYETEQIDARNSINNMNLNIFTNAVSEWDSSIVATTIRNLVPSDDLPVELKKPVSETMFIQGIFDEVRNQIDQVMLTKQMNVIQENIKYLDELVLRELPKEPVIPTQSHTLTEAIISQFNSEMEYSKSKLSQYASFSLEDVVKSKYEVEEVPMLEIDMQKLVDNAKTYSEKIFEFAAKSLDHLNSTWKSYLNAMAEGIEKIEKEKHNVDFVGCHSESRFQHEFASYAGFHFEKDFIKLNTLRLQVKDDKQNIVDQCIRIENGIHAEYQVLLNDIQQEVIGNGKNFSVVRKKVYDDFFRRVNNTKNSAVYDITKENISIEEAMKRTEEEFNAMAAKINKHNQQMRKVIAKMRIMTHLDNLGVERTYLKAIEKVEEERKEANAILWRSKAEAEQIERKLINNLKGAHHRLARIHATIDELRQELDNERMINIQLVHWKVMNQKVIDELNNQIAQYEDPDGYDINGLVTKVEQSQAELDQLTEETDMLNEEVTTELKQRFNEIDRIRSAARTKRIINSRNFERNVNMRSDETVDYTSTITKFEQANEELRKENEEMKNKIEKLLQEKMSKSRNTIQFMEQASKPRSFKSSQVSKRLTKSSLSHRSAAILRPAPRSSSKLYNI